MIIITVLTLLVMAHAANSTTNKLNLTSLNKISGLNETKHQTLKQMQRLWSADQHPDIGRPTPDMIRRQGYPVEVHWVTTEDGYILEMHRIPNPGKPVIFLQHGFLCASSDWVLMGTTHGLAYLLFNRGYDIWMGNSRGNTYSRNHTYLNPDKDSEFWNFSWHEMGLYDITAEIDHVLAKTNNEELIYIGHSQGTTQFFVMLSEKPEYNAKIKQMHALAPVAFMRKVRSPLALLAPFVDQIEWLLSILGVNEFLPNSDFMNFIGQNICNDGAWTQIVCTNVLFLVVGYDTEQLNETALPVIMSHTPAGASSKQILHYGQEMKSSKFRHYDYGNSGNWIYYGQSTPPEYDVSKISTKIYIYYSENDWMTHPKDVVKLYKELPNCQGKFRVPRPQFNHLDFLWAIDVKELLYDTIFSLLNRD